jgi:NAD(P) transhydrogenase subunit beta
MNPGIIAVAYLGASALFILALGGLSHQETARRGNWYGIAGMALALVVTIVGIVTANYVLLIVALVLGGALGYYLARSASPTRSSTARRTWASRRPSTTSRPTSAS